MWYLAWVEEWFYSWGEAKFTQNIHVSIQNIHYVGLTFSAEMSRNDWHKNSRIKYYEYILYLFETVEESVCFSGGKDNPIRLPLALPQPLLTAVDFEENVCFSRGQRHGWPPQWASLPISVWGLSTAPHFPQPTLTAVDFSDYCTTDVCCCCYC